MSLYKAYIDTTDESRFIWKKFGKEYLRMAYSLNLTNVGVKHHRATPVEKDGYLLVSPFYESWDRYNKAYYTYVWHYRIVLACGIFR